MGKLERKKEKIELKVKKEATGSLHQRDNKRLAGHKI